MTFYLIDFENLSDNVFSLINIPPSDKIQTYLFYRPNSAHTIDLRKVKHLKVDPIECIGNKKEFVDNIVSSYLGFLIAKNEYVKDEQMSYIVVSSDDDFSQVCDHWKKSGYDVSFIYITQEEKTKKKTPSNKPAEKKQTEKKSKSTDKLSDKKQKIIDIGLKFALSQEAATDMAKKIGKETDIQLINKKVLKATKDGQLASKILTEIKKILK